ncbi:MAG: DUF4384 domain-containing protein [Blastocatellia bacterium]|nr:DUF4384 domain-containing protein [Blastocatellia bacterium]
MRVAPNQIFHTGDNVRFQLEPGMDGYLYIFHAENDEKQKMLFPDIRLNGGNNEVFAHSLVEIPSAKEEDPAHRWFHFIGNSATENFYFIVTRKPLPSVPSGKELKDYLEHYGGQVWVPSQALWKQLRAWADRQEIQETERNFGLKETLQEQQAKTKRDIVLGSDAPSPTNLKIAVSRKTGMVVIHAPLNHQ